MAIKLTYPPSAPSEIGLDRFPKVGIIGGSGLYDPGIFEDAKEIQIHTPYGLPSDNIIVGKVAGRPVAFLPRHGRGHKYPPHKIPYKANIYALNALGVTSIIAVSAVGSLRPDYAPGDFVVPDQFIDMTKGRDYTFYDGPRTCHVQIGLEPFTQEIRRALIDAARKYNKTHDGGCYVCIEGPRFSTKAESRVWREVFGCDIIGMTLVPEINLARELGMCYGLVALVTDYDIWVPHQPVTAEAVEKMMVEKIGLIKKVVTEVVPQIPDEMPKCREVLRYACI
ncbi:MAG: S-methyl-5'-thioadenosine phosphorylase [Pyrobaculum sp.]